MTEHILNMTVHIILANINVGILSLIIHKRLIKYCMAPNFQG